MVKCSAGRINVYVSGPSHGPYIVLLHGYGPTASGLNWIEYSTRLARRGFRVCAVDFPGFGLSEGKKYSSRTEYHQLPGGPVEVVLEVVQWLGEEGSSIGATPGAVSKGADESMGMIPEENMKPRAHIVGYDYGGGVALATALSRPSAVLSVTSFHGSWSLPHKHLCRIQCPCLILQVKRDQFHLSAKAKQINKSVGSNSRYLELSCGAFNAN